MAARKNKRLIRLDRRAAYEISKELQAMAMDSIDSLFGRATFAYLKSKLPYVTPEIYVQMPLWSIVEAVPDLFEEILGTNYEGANMILGAVNLRARAADGTPRDVRIMLAVPHPEAEIPKALGVYSPSEDLESGDVVAFMPRASIDFIMGDPGRNTDLIYATLIHEMTHALDPSIRPKKGKEYGEQPAEIRAFSRQVAEDVVQYLMSEKAKGTPLPTTLEGRKKMLRDALDNSFFWEAAIAVIKRQKDRDTILRYVWTELDDAEFFEGVS